MILTGYDIEQYFIRDETTSVKVVVQKFVSYLEKISNKAFEILQRHFRDIYDQVCSVLPLCESILCINFGAI